MMERKKKAYLQIGLLIVSVFAFSYIIGESSGDVLYLEVRKKEINWMNILKVIIGLVFNDKGLVSAQGIEASDLQDGVATCLEGEEGICQQYPRSQCDNKCDGNCLPQTAEGISACDLGTCFDPNVGTCQENSPRKECEINGGRWFDDPAGNVKECQNSCCVVGDRVRPLITLRECKKIGETLGIETEYRADIRNEIQCLSLEKTQAQGACVLGLEEDRTCRFVTKQDCLTSNGEFYEGLLCTHPDLNMGYKKQASAKCVEGLHEVYWFDSEGNRENIYSSNKVKSWNKGMILEKSDSCSLGNTGNAFANRKDCGNCNILLGSVCGQRTKDEKLLDNSIDVVCKDIRCRDSSGKVRENGESWCEYQGDIGIGEGSGGFNRSVDTVGSRHFRAVCIDGEVQVDPCADYRNQICIEERGKREGDKKEISNAECISNLWQICLHYNSEVGDKQGSERENAIETRNDQCIENPHCILKNVYISDSFTFDLCVPRFSPGFDLQENAEGGELSCAFANQKCTVIKVKELGGWKTKVNEGCLQNQFAEQMNDLCMSLGDCGASVNYQGDLSESYRVYNSPELNEEYLEGISKYSEPVKGKYARTNASEYFKVLGGIEKLAGVFDPSLCDNLPGLGGEVIEGTCPDFNTAGIISGLAGVALIYGGTKPAVAAAFNFLATPGWQAAGGAVAGAAIGFAVTSMLIHYTGIGAGLDPAVTWALIGAGTVAGAMVGAALLSSAGFFSFGASLIGGLIGLGPVGLIILVVVIIVIAVFAALGIGKTEEIVVEFHCQPWQAKLGGSDCSKCGSDGFLCSKYACQSLGQTCELINEGTGDEACVDISPNDVTPPVIQPWEEILSEGYELNDINDKGFKIVSKDNDGCIKANSPMTFGIELNEAGQCRFNMEHTTNYNDMINEKGGDFGGRNLFLDKHSQPFTIPDLASFGLPGYDPERRVDLTYNVRCLDKKGNGKDSSEYVISLCLKPGEDKTLPTITGRYPVREEIIFNATKLTGSVFTYEPADCRWSLNNERYDEMENDLECKNGPYDRGLLGWRCNAEFPIENDEEKLYIQCLDQPWRNESERFKRNEMSGAYEYIIKRTSEPLIIESVTPADDVLEFGVQPATVEIEVLTLGGADNGRATCYLGGSEMEMTFQSSHFHSLNMIFEGAYKMAIRCVDFVGNSAISETKFTALLDVAGPRVTRVYNQAGSLTVITDEDAECSFVNVIGKNRNACNFEIDDENVVAMSGTGKVHTSGFDGTTHYVKCRDRYGNSPGGCGVIVRGG